MSASGCLGVFNIRNALLTVFLSQVLSIKGIDKNMHLSEIGVKRI